MFLLEPALCQFIYLNPVMDPQLKSDAAELRDRIMQIAGHL